MKPYLRHSAVKRKYACGGLDDMKKTTLAFMAAGFGSRFGGGVKQIEPVGPHGEVLMEYAVYDALRAGFDRVVFIIRRDIEAQFRDGVGRRVEKKCDVAYAYQDVNDVPGGFSLPEGRKKPWGTGHAVLACRELIHEPFCVLNADDYYGTEAFERIHAYISAEDRRPGLDCCMAGYVLGNTLTESGGVTRGICKLDEDSRLREVRETRNVVLRNGMPCIEMEGEARALDANAVVSMNIWGLPADFIGYLEECFPSFLERLGEDDCTSEFLLPTIISRMVHRGDGTVKVLPTVGKWFGMTYMQDKLLTQQKIRELIDRGRYPEEL